MKAKEMHGGFRYIHVHGPCAPGWRFPENKVIEIARLAVQCGMWLLYEVEYGNMRLTYTPKPRKNVNDYLSRQGRFSHLTEDDISEIQKEVNLQCEKHNF
jgi:pyruvate ferredoxin oxidoreductase beta subunit